MLFRDAVFQKLNVLLSASLLHYHWCVRFCNLTGQDLQMLLDAKYADKEISWQLEIICGVLKIGECHLIMCL